MDVLLVVLWSNPHIARNEPTCYEGQNLYNAEESRIGILPFAGDNKLARRSEHALHTTCQVSTNKKRIKIKDCL